MADSLSLEMKVGNYYALIVAIQSYGDPNISSLDRPISDARRLEQVLRDEYGFNQKNVLFLKNPTREEMFATFDSLAKEVNADDNLLLFYAGHGFWDEKKEQGYWLPSDSKKENRSKWISNSDLRDQIRGLKSKHTLLISDACFSGGIFRTRSAFEEAEPAITELYRNASRKAMTSGAMTQVPDKSVFVEYLVKKLRDNQEAFLPSQRLFAEMREVVINNSPLRQAPQYGTIMETGDEGGDFIFFKPSAVKKSNTLIVSTNIEDAEIRLNGNYLGKSNPIWRERKVNPGKNLLEVRKQGYATVKREVEMPESGEFRVNIDLELLHLADIAVDVSQPEATVYLDGRIVGKTSEDKLTVNAHDLAWGTHLVEVQATGYKKFQQEVFLSENREYPVVVTLKQNTAKLVLKGFVNAKIFLSDVYVGDAPAKEIEIPLGSNEIRLAQKGYEDFGQDISALPDQRYTIDYTMTRKTTMKAFTRSLVFPGRGQFYQDRDGIGGLYFGLFVGALAAIGYFQIDVIRKTSTYNSAYDTYAQERSVSLIPSKRALLKQANDDLNSATAARKYAMMALAGVYVLNLLDVTLLAPEWKPNLAKIDFSYSPFKGGTIKFRSTMNF